MEREEGSGGQSGVWTMGGQCSEADKRGLWGETTMAPCVCASVCIFLLLFPPAYFKHSLFTLWQQDLSAGLCETGCPLLNIALCCSKETGTWEGGSFEQAT